MKEINREKKDQARPDYFERIKRSVVYFLLMMAAIFVFYVLYTSYFN
jgi:hypothetical protein